MQSFHDFARIASIEADNTGFEGLVCDDGVALYWFDVETEKITGFHFFTKSEINRILSGSPVSCGLVVKNGQYALGEDSELAIAFKECLFRRLPPLSSDPVVAEQTPFRSLSLTATPRRSRRRSVLRADTSASASKCVWKDSFCRDS